jgi:hypothetical protein
LKIGSAVVLLLLMSVLTGCGFKGAPIAPERTDPARIDDLTVKVVDGEVILQFTLPTRLANGKPLEQLDALMVYRLSPAQGRYFCRTCGDEPELAFSVSEGIAAPGEKFSVSERFVAGEQFRAAYSVVACRSLFSCGKASSTVEVELGFAPQAPQKPELKVAGGLVLLAWPEVETLIDGSPMFDLVGYRVVREGQIRQESSLVAANVYVDPMPLYGLQATYTVRAVRLRGETEIAGPPSPEVEVTVVDLAPPPVPRGLSLSAVSGEVRLHWEPVATEEVVVVRIYRRQGSRGEFEKIAEVEAGEALYIDTAVLPSVKYFYKLTAVDSSPAANESASCLPRRITIDLR